MSSEPAKTSNALLQSREQVTAQQWLSARLARIRSGDLGQLPIILGLVVICILFQIANPVFLSSFNLINLLVQAATVITIAYGVVIILLLGEIDLSMGYTAGVTAVIIALLMREPIVIEGLTSAEGFAVPWYLALAAGLGVAVLIGFAQGFLVTRFKLPSFIVTLAGQLALSGVVLLTVKGLGTLSFRDATILGSVRTFLQPLEGTIFLAAVVLIYAASEFVKARTRRAAGLNATPPAIILLQTGLLAAAMALFAFVAFQSRGIPMAIVIVIITLGVLTYVTTQTRFGRYLFAVGGNKEAARRAGIPVERIRIYGFMLGSFLAGMGGVFLLARLGSVSPDTGGGPLLLNSIAAAVIGGTSLFGGSGRVSSALLGGLVIATVDNGLGLIPNIPADAKFILTAIILVLAVIIDALARSRQQASGAR